MKYRLIVPALFLVASCSVPVDHQGDGVLIDRGAGAAVDRYVLEVGEIVPGTQTFTLRVGPRERFVVGLRLPRLDAEAARAEVLDRRIQLEVRLNNSDGATIFHENAPLADWVWTCGVGGNCDVAFAYRRAGSTPGTYFQAPLQGLVEVTASSDEQDEFLIEQEAMLVLRGGGWK